MKTKPEEIDAVADGGVAKASKAIKKEKKEKQVKKESVVLAAANSVAEDTNETQAPPKKHKKKDAKRLAKLAKGGNVQNGVKKEETNGQMNNPSDTAKTDQEPSAKKEKSKKPKALPDDEDPESESDQEDSAKQAETEVEEKEGKKVKKGPEYTLFVGNLPTTTNERKVRSLFQKYGRILSVRIRTNTGDFVNRKMLKKVTAINSYVRFANKEIMTKACEMDGQMVEQNRIRVTPHDVKPLGPATSTIFVGNLRAGTTDTELYDLFSAVGEIEYVRQIPNRFVAFVCFKKGVSIKKAFKLDLMLNGRPLRVQQVDPKKTNVKRNKKGHLVKKNRLPNKKKGTGEGSTPAKDFHGKVVNESDKKKKKKSVSKTEKAKRTIAEKLKAAMKVRK